MLIIRLFLIVCTCLVSANAAVTNLLCEYRTDPIGIEAEAPRLSWQSVSDERGYQQAAYRIRVASSETLLMEGKADLWDSGKIQSSQSLHVPYAGAVLQSRQICFWIVEVWGPQGRRSISEPASWEMGLLSSDDWGGANWIQLAKDTRESVLKARSVHTFQMDKPRMALAHPSPLLRREFTVGPDVLRARAYVCGLGYNELYINGEKCGDAVLEPGQTSYDVRAFYVVHDITQKLETGANAAGVTLGNGFYGQNQAFNAPGLGYGEPLVMAMLVIDYVDGSTETLVTDDLWKANTGPIVYDNVYAGETYDARLERIGWNRVGYDDSGWQVAKQVQGPTVRIEAQQIPPIRAVKTLPVAEIIQGADGQWIFDFGQNISGWPRIKIKAPRGTQLSMNSSEILNKDGTGIDMSTTGTHATGLKQTNIYICKGEGVEVWEPRFTYHGFRYIEVTGLLEPPSKDFIQAVFVRTDVPSRGNFECSNELLNQIYRTSIWTIEDNMHSILEDCPHREKCAWLGDAHAVGETVILNYGTAQFWTKFVDDIETTLGRGGITYWKRPATPGIPCNIAVGKRLCQEARPDWGSAYVLLPWYLYQYYGDTDLFTRHYDHLKDWMAYVADLSEDGIVHQGYGDWCPPNGNKYMESPVPLTSTAFYFATLEIMATFADELELPEDAAQYRQLADQTKAAFNRKFYDADEGCYGSQTANAVALRFGLAPKGAAERVGDALRSQVVERHDGHARVGIHGARPLYTKLSQYGYTDVAISAMTRSEFPSYSHALDLGLTTWPELFRDTLHVETLSGRSLNHPMQSGFAAWFHESIGGMTPSSPAFKMMHLKPHGYAELAWAKVDHTSPYGLIKSHWRSESGVFYWELSIPPNTTATVHVPTAQGQPVLEGGEMAETAQGVEFLDCEKDRAIYKLQSGHYNFKSHWKE